MSMADTAMPSTLPSDSVAVTAAPPPPALALAGARVPVSATLAANETMARKRRAGQPVLPLAFGEAGLPVTAPLRGRPGGGGRENGYGPVAGLARCARRRPATGRAGHPHQPGHRGLRPGQQGPRSFGLLLALGGRRAPCRGPAGSVRGPGRA